MFFIFSPKPSLAVSEFKTDYNVNYDVSADGSTQVTEKINLTNLTETYFASNFVLTIGSTSLSEITASDQGGTMEVSSQIKNNQTIVTLKFNEQITGINKTQTFTLKYKSNDFASKVGESWEVNLPRIHEGVDIETYNLNLSVPMSFGEPTSINPKPKSESDGLGKLVLTFNKDNLAGSGVSVNFGSNQAFDFNLKYNLNNSSFLPTVESISLPMNTNYQDVAIKKITPEPLNVTIDADGNYLAWYQLRQRSNQEITVEGSVKLYINPKQEGRLTKSQISALTKSDKYWEKDNPSIKAVIAQIFKNGVPKTTREKARLIYRYVVSVLKFNPDSSNQTRLGALTSLLNTDKAKAEEFTDLFITLARADSIPARELDGLSYSQNKMLRPLSLTAGMTHAWPEYYDENTGWVMVDPTWEQTSGGVNYFDKLDLNHFVVNIRGNSSTIPIPVENGEMKISQGEFNAAGKADVEIDVNSSIWAGLPGSFKVKVINNGTTVIPSDNLSINAGKINLLSSNIIPVVSIPPHGFAAFDVNFRTPFLTEGGSDEITILYQGQQYKKQVNITTFFLLSLLPYLFGSVFFLIFAMYVFILGLHIKKTHKK